MKAVRPPLAARLILAHLLDEDIRQAALADCRDWYEQLRHERGRLHAALWYWAQIFQFLPGIMTNHLFWSTLMWTSTLKSSMRHLQKSRGFTSINLFGLTLGLTCSLLILIYVHYELSYDHFLQAGDRVCRVVMHQPGNMFQGSDYFNVTPAPLRQAVLDEIPEVERFARFNASTGAIVTVGDKSLLESRFLDADPDVIDIFELEFISGDAGTALDAPFTVILSESAAHRYFGRDNPVGKTLRKNHEQDYTVTGVYRDLPPNTHIKLDVLGSFQSLVSTMGEEDLSKWNNNSYYAYMRLKTGSTLSAVTDKLEAIVQSHTVDEEYRFFPQPLEGIHLGGNINFEWEPNTDKRMLFIFSGIGFIILLTAVLNYMNLATARSLKRAREVGLRKVVGASRRGLIRQYLSEALLYALFSLLAAVLIVWMLLPAFGQLMARDLSAPWLFRGSTLLLTLGLTLLTGLASGIYPALFLSGFPPQVIFKDLDRSGRSRTQKLRSALVTLQFILSAALISATLIMQKQMHFIRHKDLGFNQDFIYTVYVMDPDLRQRYQPMQEALRNLPGVLDITASKHIPVTIRGNSHARYEGMEEGQSIPTFRMKVDYNTLEFYGIKLKAGRNFSENMTSDRKEAVILNQTVVDQLGWDDPIGKQYSFTRSVDQHVIGVVEDFHYYSMHLAVKPLAIMLFDSDSQWDAMRFLSLRVSRDNLKETIARIQDTARGFSPRYPLRFGFLDERVQKMYSNESRLLKAFNSFSLLAVSIACLGLLGLASFMAEQRAKEISIRKVLGASSASVSVLLVRNFMRWIVLANLIAIPIVWMVMTRWLERFSYRISMTLDTFTAGLLLSLMIALGTVAWQTLKAARAQPAATLRRES